MFETGSLSVCLECSKCSSSGCCSSDCCVLTDEPASGAAAAAEAASAAAPASSSNWQFTCCLLPRPHERQQIRALALRDGDGLWLHVEQTPF